MMEEAPTMPHSGSKPYIRGVNLGGWLVPERFITPYLFALTECHVTGDFRFYPNQIDAPPTSSPLYKPMDRAECPAVEAYPVDPWTLMAAFPDKSVARRYMEIHWDNFLKRDDISFLKNVAGVTHIRVPLSHWIVGDGAIAEGEPWVAGAWPYFQRLVGWCRDEGGLEIWPDIHTAPGSQNGFDNSGLMLPDPTCHQWDTNPAHVARSLQAVDRITAAIRDHNMTDIVKGFGVLNEPFVDCDVNVVRTFYEQSLTLVRKNMGPHTAVYIGDMFNAAKFNDGFWTDEDKYRNTYLDSHYYHVFDERARHLSPRQHIAFVCQTNRFNTEACCYEDYAQATTDAPNSMRGDKSRHSQLTTTTNTIPANRVSRIIGEWSAGFDTLVFMKLNDVMTSIRETGVAAEFNRIIPPARQTFLRRFVEAQMVVFEAAETGVSRGWFYWTFKTEGGAFAEWDFSRGVRESWIPPIPAPDVASVDLYGTCYDIIKKTDDDMSIVHEFPDPAINIDANNWQRVHIDDDVVISHGNTLVQDRHGDWVTNADYADTKTTPQSFNNHHPPTFFGDGGLYVITLFLIAIGIVHYLRTKKKAGYTKLVEGLDMELIV